MYHTESRDVEAAWLPIKRFAKYSSQNLKLFTSGRAWVTKWQWESYCKMPGHVRCEKKTKWHDHSIFLNTDAKCESYPNHASQDPPYDNFAVSTDPDNSGGYIRKSFQHGHNGGMADADCKWKFECVCQKKCH